MRWQYKAVLMDLFSACPGGDRLHYWTQRHVTKSLPRNETELKEKFAYAKSHIEALMRHGSKPVSDAQFYEFGAGWDLMIPFCFYSLGVRSQILADLFALARVDLVNDSMRRISRLQEETEAMQMKVRPVPEDGNGTWIPFVEQEFGIRYVAPCDARSTGLEAKSVDCITSTDTLEHIPEEEIRLILRECRRILRKDGVLSFVIDYQDHYWYCDGRIPRYNFLRYAESTWKWFNPRFHYQNRLRHKDYIRLVEEQGFEVVEDKPSRVSPEDVADLKRVSLAPPFRRGYLPEELAVRRGHLVLRPASA